MGYASYETVARAWVQKARGWDVKIPKNERMWASSNGDELYSYGSHFTLVQALRDKKRNLTAFLVNGDTFSPTTGKHQSEVRSALAQCDTPTVIIPFSALGAAGLDRDTVEIIDVLPDRMVTTTRTYTEIQNGWRWHQVPVRSSRPRTPEELRQTVYARNVDAAQEHHHRVQLAFEQLLCPDTWPSWRGDYSEYLPGGFLHERVPMTVGDLSHWDTYDVDFIECYYQRLHTSGHAHAPEVEIIEVGGEVVEYRVSTERHWLGESLIRAVVPETRRVKCEDCGGTGLPQPRVERQDRFGTDLRHHGCDICGFWRHVADGPRGSGTKQVTRRRKAMFLSGFDHNETRELYFFSELPNTRPRTVEEAYEALKPPMVKMAEMMGREVQRQGDIFAVPLPGLTKRELRAQGARFEKRGTLLGTNHVATEVARLKGGVTLARGTLTHAPDFRRPDHKRVTLPHGTWHVTVKNTVPITGGR